jgi:CHASE2 domain-containing sensor protein
MVLAILRLDGDLEQGIRAILTIETEDKHACIEVSGSLPANPNLAKTINQWQFNYRSLGSTRILPIKITYDSSINQRRQQCQELDRELRSHLNNWLLAESFRPIRDKWLERLMHDEVRVLIRTQNLPLLKLPWQLWDAIERNSRLEVALSTPDFEPIASAKTPLSNRKNRILAILGDSKGIDLQQDRQLLNNLANTQITFLVEPQRREINDHLWEQDWDILFFAGHSKTEGEKGRIYINQTDSLTIAELRYGLKKAVDKGLQLAIFNSCDGMGLAFELQQLHIPQIIVMREPVPDRVAQAFLTYFLSAFAGGQSLYLAEREARLRLQGLEDEFPGASWLPAIFQNPATEPFTWCRDRPTHKPDRSLQTVLLVSLAVTSLIIGVRQLGILQPWELQAFDRFMQLRTQEKQDSRLLIVTVTEEDFQLPEQKLRKGSLSDLALTRLLKKLVPMKPRAIGLDIYRDFPVSSHQKELSNYLNRNDNFFAICKASDRQSGQPGISPPPEVPPERLGFSDIIKDSDGILRRHLIAIQPVPTSPCTTPYALSAQLAFQYLAKEGFTAKYTATGELQLGNVIFKRLPAPRKESLTNAFFEYLQAHRGAYQQVDAWGYQILLNYRSHRSPEELAPTVTLKQVLAGEIDPATVSDRIVLIGVTAPSANDLLSTPYSTGGETHHQMPGVIAQAQMVSQILSAVLEGRPLLSVWAFWQEILWIWSWSLVGGIVVWRCRPQRYLVLVGGVVVGILWVFSLGLFVQGLWIPFVPSVLAVGLTGGSLIFYWARPQKT